MTLPVALVQAFGAEPLGGNGAAVVRLNAPAQGSWMQQLAGCLKQSETAFLWRQPNGSWALRWFTPACEVPLCGHATLAATVALAHWGDLHPGARSTLATRSGGLEVCWMQGPDGTASLVLPSQALQPLPIASGLQRLLGVELLAYWGSALGYRVALLPDTVALADLPSPAGQLQGGDRQGLVLMQACSSVAIPLLGRSADYQLRFFAPGLGIDEDPVTGSAHALVAPWWMQQLRRATVLGWQCSPWRGGMLCEHAQAGHVRLTGRGHLLWHGHLEAGDGGCDPEGWGVCQHASAPAWTARRCGVC